VNHECAEESVLFLDGDLSAWRAQAGSPFWAKGSRQPNTESHIQGGNDLNEAGRREASGHNASEGMEPRNLPSYWRSRLFMKSQAALFQPIQARLGEPNGV
jgi:hypothetical protein